MDSKENVPLLSEEQLTVRRRRRLMYYTALAVLLILAVGGVWGYYASLPYRAEARVREGLNLMNLGYSQAAIDSFNQALQLDPSRTDVYQRRGLAYQNLGKTEMALQDYDRAPVASSNQAAVLTARGIIDRGRGELQKAVDEFTKALAIRDDSDTHYERAQTYELMHEYQKAIADMDIVVTALRDATHILRARAFLKQQVGDDVGSRADFAAAQAFEKRAMSGQRAPEPKQ